MVSIDLLRSPCKEPKGNFRATGQSKTAGNTQVPELQELIDCIFERNKETERAGFEPAVP